jgi:uncharacterized protein (DUF2062 family)
MSKKLFKRFLPDIKKIKNDKYLKIFGKLIHDPNLWHLNRYSVSTAFSAGLFAALMPVPFQMLLASALCIIFRGNLPIAAALTWATNPITTPPIAYFCYLVGTFIMGKTPQHAKFEISYEWLMKEIGGIGLPFIIGSIVVSIVVAILSNIAIRLIWRWAIVKAWRERHSARSKARRKKKRAQKKLDI